MKKFSKNFEQVSQNLGSRFANFAEILQSGTKKLAISGKRVDRAECSYRTDHTKGLEVSLSKKISENLLIGWPESLFAFCQFWAKPWGGSLKRIFMTKFAILWTFPSFLNILCRNSQEIGI